MYYNGAPVSRTDIFKIELFAFALEEMDNKHIVVNLMISFNVDSKHSMIPKFFDVKDCALFMSCPRSGVGYLWFLMHECRS
jgi:hypothetical protein